MLFSELNPPPRVLKPRGLFLQSGTANIYVGDNRRILRSLPAKSHHCCVTSPPYYGLRDYGIAGQIGLEQTPDAYIAELVEVFRGVRRVLRDDGTLWLNLGDTYASAWPCNRRNVIGNGSLSDGSRGSRPPRMGGDLKEKDLIGIPWMAAFALRADGWYLRSHIIWHKPNPMPEAVKDRPTSAHESVFLFAKQPTYFYDAEAVAEKSVAYDHMLRYSENPSISAAIIPNRNDSGPRSTGGIARPSETRNLRNVWTITPTITPKPYKGAHFAIMPERIVDLCIRAGTKQGDVVLDPFAGVGTTGLVAGKYGRHSTLIELNPKWAEAARKRLLVEEVPAEIVKVTTRRRPLED